MIGQVALCLRRRTHCRCFLAFSSCAAVDQCTKHAIARRHHPHHRIAPGQCRRLIADRSATVSLRDDQSAQSHDLALTTDSADCCSVDIAHTTDAMTEGVIALLSADSLTTDAISDLRWNDIDWSTGSIIVRPPCAHRCLVGLTLGLPERRTHRHRHVSPQTLAALRSLRERDMLRRVRDGKSWFPTDSVICRPWGTTPPFARAQPHERALPAIVTPWKVS